MCRSADEPLVVAMVAGEASGDLLAGLLLDGLKAHWPALQAAGIGGPHMERRGFQAWWPHDKLSVHGYGWEVLRRYSEIVGIRDQLKQRLLRNPPEVFVGVDAPDFNLDLDLVHLEQAALWIRQSGGRVELQGEAIRFGPDGCLSASGTARSDVLERNQEILGTGWSPMQGELRCEGTALVIPLESENTSGTRFGAELRVAPQQPGRFDARVSGLIPRDLAFALPIAGFAPDGRDWVYSFSTSDRSGPT